MNHAISFPTSAIVFTYYWTLVLNDRNNIGSDAAYADYPWWMDLMEHGVVLPAALINILLEPFTLTPLVGYIMAAASTGGYVSWLQC